MKIHQIIRTRRQALGLTQEQLAGKLGVSAPAVNKWERGNSYPDITLLPVLARTLGVDLNTLLSFQEDLTEQEIGEFLCRLHEEGR
ncbi:helix-turn-helix domain-containing protein [Dysosmobacter sp.]